MDGRVKRKTFAELMAEAALQGMPEDKTTADLLNVPLSRGAILPLTEYLDRAEFDLSSGLPGAFADAVTAPARAARGEISEDQQIPEAFNFAGSLTLGSLLAPRPTGSVGMGGRAGKEALDMSEAARMARAKEMGFDTKNRLYHGTQENVEQFSDSMIGSANDAGALGSGHYFTDEPRIANWYAQDFDGSNVVPAYVKDANLFKVEASGVDHNLARGANKTVDLLTEFAKRHPDIAGKDFDPMTYARDLSEFSNSGAGDDIAELLGRAGYEGVDYGFKGGGREVAMFDPSNIRSVNAAFDPAQSSSANLLAANAKTGAAVPLATKALEAQQPQGIRAFHGSPHDFDRFSMEHIGKGEGAQAYGHGLYFAEAEDVARSYRDTLSDSTTPSLRYEFGGQTYERGSPEWKMLGTIANRGIREAKSILNQYKKDIAAGERYAAELGPDFVARAEAIVNASPKKKDIKQIAGNMYEVNIKADPNDFLDYDAGISRQPEKVRQALSKIADDAGIPRGGFGDEIRSGDLDTLRTYVEQSLPRGEFEKRLKDLGIPGIRYLDQMSRGAGEGSSNYVVFDDAIIDIVKKYGIAGLALLQAAGYGENEGEETQ